MTKECNENDERRITISGNAKQVDLNWKASSANFYEKCNKGLKIASCVKVRYARLMINDVIAGERGPRSERRSQNQVDDQT